MNSWASWHRALSHYPSAAAQTASSWAASPPLRPPFHVPSQKAAQLLDCGQARAYFPSQRYQHCLLKGFWNVLWYFKAFLWKNLDFPPRPGCAAAAAQMTGVGNTAANSGFKKSEKREHVFTNFPRFRSEIWNMSQKLKTNHVLQWAVGQWSSLGYWCDCQNWKPSGAKETNKGMLTLVESRLTAIDK